MRFSVLCVLLSCAISACATDIAPAMKRFVDGKDIVVKERGSIYPYLESRAVSLEHVQENQSGMVEYFFVQTNKLFVDPDKRCRFVFVVTKDTGAIVGWKYNDKPEYCLQSR